MDELDTPEERLIWALRQERVQEVHLIGGRGGDMIAPFRLIEKTDGACLNQKAKHMPDISSFLTYALFHNPETGDYLVTMRDSRPVKNPIVDWEDIKGAGKDIAAIRAEAHAIWERNFDTLTAFHPIADRDRVMALHEARRIRSMTDSNGPARPTKSLFSFFHAFIHAYQKPEEDGTMGFLRALNDVFGPQGNVMHLREMGVQKSCWGGVTKGDARLAEMYDIGSADFLNLYEKMSDIQRGNFKSALNHYMRTGLYAVFNDAAGSEIEQHDRITELSTSLWQIIYAVEHGTGGLENPACLDAMRRIEKNIRDAATGKLTWPPPSMN